VEKVRARFPRPSNLLSFAPDMSLERRTLIGRSAVLVAAQGVRVASLAAFFVLAARRLGESGFGDFQFAFSYCAIWTSVADFGFSLVVLREASKFRDRLADYVGNTLLLRIPLAVLIYGLMILFLPVLELIPAFRPSAEAVSTVSRLGASFLLSSLLLVFYAAFRTRDNTWFEGLGISLGALLTLVFGLVALRRGAGAPGLGTAMLAASGVVFLLESAVAALRYGLYRFRVDFALLREIVRQAVPLGWGTVGYQIYYQSDVILLYIFHGRVAVGIYGAAYQLVTILLQAPVAYFKTVLPHFARAAHESQSRFERLLAETASLMASVSLPLSVSGCLLAGILIPIVYPSGYAGTASVFAVVVWVTAFAWIGQTFTNALIACGKSHWYQRYSLYAAAMNFSLNLVVIPRFGPLGAAATTVFTEAVVNALFYWRTRREGIDVPLGRILVRPLATAAGVGILLAILLRIPSG
jgi:O-antigen/teichoic acid export membrane protein